MFSVAQEFLEEEEVEEEEEVKEEEEVEEEEEGIYARGNVTER